MWMNHQNLNKPRKDKNGKKWNFRVWFDVWTETKVLSAQRVFFWDDAKQSCGVVVLIPGSEMHVSRLKQMIANLVADPRLREKYRRELRFPLERHYSEYGVFPEERAN
jgi:hypothetical protein